MMADGIGGFYAKGLFLLGQIAFETNILELLKETAIEASTIAPKDFRVNGLEAKLKKPLHIRSTQNVKPFWLCDCNPCQITVP